MPAVTITAAAIRRAAKPSLNRDLVVIVLDGQQLETSNTALWRRNKPSNRR